LRGKEGKEELYYGNVKIVKKRGEKELKKKRRKEKGRKNFLTRAVGRSLRCSHIY